MTPALPLIVISEGRKPRARKAAAYKPKEITLHMSVAKILRDHCLSDWQWTHIGHGEKRSIKTASKLKQMGMKRGWPDFVLIEPSGRLHCLELKRIGGKLTDEQENFRTWCIIHGLPYVVAHSIDHVMEAFHRWCCLNDGVVNAWRASKG